MRHDDFVHFLRSVAPRLGLDPSGYRNVGSTVKKRVRRRLAELGLSSLDAYGAYLESHREEWSALDAMCRIPISRLYRDARVYDIVASEVLPERARAAVAEGRRTLRVWSAGCASGEEPYTIAAIWRFEVARAFPALTLEIVATDVSEEMCERTQRGLFDPTSLRELPERLRSLAFVREGDHWQATSELRAHMAVVREDLRATYQSGPFDVVLCRNLAFTYFDEPTRGCVLDRFAERLVPGGYLIVGKGETIPASMTGFVPTSPCIYRFDQKTK